MQSTQNFEQKTIEEILDAHLALISTNTEAWAELLAENIIVEFPYAAALSKPPRLEGKAAVYNYVKAAIAPMQNLTFINVRKYPTTDPHVIWAEVHGEAIITTTGCRYQQDYVVRMESKDSKVVYYREYWNPVAVIAAWGDTQSQRDLL